MSFTVCGCGVSFKSSGLRSHQRQSLDVRCQAQAKGTHFDNYHGDCDMSENMDIDSQSFIKDIIKNTTGAEYSNFEVDPTGDLFGDYQDYIPGEFGMDYLDSNVSDDESEGTFDEEELILTNGSEVLEPERLPPSESCPLPDNSDLNRDETDSTTGSVGKASRLRGGAEEILQKRPFVVKFTKGRAGATFVNQHVDEDNLNASYTCNIANAKNPSPFSPFSSKLEWDVAHWAKMRGPSSTAFNELIEIEGVSIVNWQATLSPTLG
jgi:hypothetical protein